jgi:hypothetical protein
MMGLIELVNKLKVAMEVLLGCDQTKLRRIQYLYYQRVSLYPEDFDEEQDNLTGSKLSGISNFFDRNEKENLKDFKTELEKQQF